MRATPFVVGNIVRMSAQVNGDGEMKTVHAKIKGRVQGVFYRNWAVDTATQLGLHGWVRNRRDGSVEAVFAGKPSIVDSMVQKCFQGPPAAKVSTVETAAWEGDAIRASFERHPTE